MFSKLKIYLVAGLGFLTAVFYALLQKEKAARADEHAEIAETSRKTQEKASDALVDGITKEQQVTNEKIDPTKPRDHFSS